MHIYILYTKFQPNPSTCLGGVVLTRSTLYISLVKILSGIIFPYSCLGNHLVSSTFTYGPHSVYQVSTKSIKPFRRSCTYKMNGQTDWVISWGYANVEESLQSTMEYKTNKSIFILNHLVYGDTK